MADTTPTPDVTSTTSTPIGVTSSRSPTAIVSTTTPASSITTAPPPPPTANTRSSSVASGGSGGSSSITVTATDPISSPEPGTSSGTNISNFTQPTTAGTSVPQGQDGGHNGVSPGATAGVAIAMFLVGAVIAGLIVMLLARRRRRQNEHRAGYAAAGPRMTERTEKSPAPSNLELILPQPRDDGAMKSAAVALFTQIDNHVENFYHNEPVNGAGDLYSRRTRFFAIKRLICSKMLATIDWAGDAEPSLLPNGVSAVTRTMKKDMQDPANEVVWAHWRSCTAYLLTQNRSVRDNEAREAAIGSCIAQLDQNLQPFLVASLRDSRRQDLVAICELTESLGQLILSQPARWEFVWPHTVISGGGKDWQEALTYFPAFARVTDNKAKRLDRPEEVIEAASMR